MKLSIVIPAYNEEKRIGESLDKILAFIQTKQFTYEIIIVDDGSHDRTIDVINNKFSRFNCEKKIIQNLKNSGKGYSIKRGMLEATGDYLLFSDADLSTPIDEVDKLVHYLQNGYDVAIGSRDLAESKVEIHQNFIRELMGKTFNRLARTLTFKGIHDSQCGFKCFTREAGYRLFGLQKINGFSFDVEIVYLAQKLGYKIAEVPVIWRNSAASTVKIISDPLKMFYDLFRIRFTHLYESNKTHR